MHGVETTVEKSPNSVVKIAFDSFILSLIEAAEGREGRWRDITQKFVSIPFKWYHETIKHC